MSKFDARTLQELVEVCETYGVNKTLKFLINTGETIDSFKKDNLNYNITTDLLKVLEAPNLLDMFYIDNIRPELKSNDNTPLIVKITSASKENMMYLLNLISTTYDLQDNYGTKENYISEINELKRRIAYAETHIAEIDYDNRMIMVKKNSLVDELVDKMFKNNHININ